MDCNDVGIQDTFWLQVLQAWCKYNCKEPDTKAKVSTRVLWYNSDIKGYAYRLLQSVPYDS